MANNHKQEILELLASGKIDAAEAARLLNESAKETVSEQVEPTPSEASDEPLKDIGQAATVQSPSMLRVRVSNLETGKSKVKVNIPVGMLRLGLKLGSRFSPEIESLDFNELQTMMATMESGMLVEVEDEESNEHVQVYFD